jgi:hypothetical protein
MEHLLSKDTEPFDSSLQGWPEWTNPESLPNVVSLCERLGLSQFSRELLLLCVGVELDSRLPHLCGELQESKDLKYPTLSLALRLFESAHWDALAAGSPLRRYRLVTIEKMGLMTHSQLSVDERVWQHMLGINHIDVRLQRITESIRSSGPLAVSHTHSVNQIVKGLRISDTHEIPVVQLTGVSSSDQAAISSQVCEALGLPLFRLPVVHLPDPGELLEDLTHLMEREFILDGSAFLIDGHVETLAHAANERSLARLISQVSGLFIFINRERVGTGSRKTLVYDVLPSLASEQEHEWCVSLSKWPVEMKPVAADWPAKTAKRMVGHFVLDSAKLQSANKQALGTVAAMDEQPASVAAANAVWEACKIQVRPSIDHIAQRLSDAASWSDLILPASQMETLHTIEKQLSFRQTVYGDWNFGGNTGRGRGTTVMFTGPSGTGKTLAAEALVTRLGLDLYRIDLSSTVSKYIGETEKNLGRIFDAAECGGIALLFDEADALFGKRSEVKDSKDRYANIEVSYLLQRLESFQGLVILTTNLRDSLDQAFLRRIRFVVEFPFPNTAQREGIWRHTLGVGAPLGEIDYTKLARLSVSGGTIRNIAINAAFRAAADGGVIEMKHIRESTRLEFDKAQHVLTTQDVGDWA